MGTCSGQLLRLIGRSFSSFIITGLLDFRIPRDEDAVSVIAFRGTLWVQHVTPVVIVGAGAAHGFLIKAPLALQSWVLVI